MNRKNLSRKQKVFERVQSKMLFTMLKIMLLLVECNSRLCQPCPPLPDHTKHDLVLKIVAKLYLGYDLATKILTLVIVWLRFS